MKTDANKLLKLLGLRPTGDLGPYTIYTSKRRATVIFLRSPPQKPPSHRQQAWRSNFSAAAHAWSELTNAQRADWTAAATTCRLRITAYNLWLALSLHPDQPTLDTIQRLSEQQLQTP